MLTVLSDAARRRPGLVVVTVLYVGIVATVARTPATVALCTILAVAHLCRVVLVLMRPTSRVHPGAETAPLLP